MSVIATVKAGLTVSVDPTRSKPEKNPSTVGRTLWIGVQGLAKLDWVTVWLSGLNWNWTMSPGLAVMLLGRNSVVPLGPPTVTTWTV